MIDKTFKIAVVACLAYIICLQHCGGESKQAPEVKTVVEKHYQNEIKYYPEYKPTPQIVRVVDSIPVIDSALCRQLAQEHFKERIYLDTLTTDTATIYWSAIVQHNEVKRFLAGYKVNVPFTTTITNIHPVDKRVQVYFGANAGTDTRTLYLGGELGLKTKRDVMYRTGAIVGIDGRPLFYVGSSFKIRLR